MHPHLSLTSDDYASVERLGQKDWDECLFTPLSFTLSVPHVDIVPNWALKTRGASTTLCCLFPCFGVWSAQPSHCVWPPLSPNFSLGKQFQALYLGLAAGS